MSDLAAAGALLARSLRQIPRVKADVAQALFIPVFFFAGTAAIYSAVARIPGFPAGSYAEFLLPQIVVWTAFMSANGSAYGLVLEVKTGYMDKLLVMPIARTSILLGRYDAVAVRACVQALIIVALAWVFGIRFETGLPGVLAVLVPVALLAVAWGAFASWVGLATRSPEAVEGIMILFIPLTYLTTGAMPLDLMPETFRVFVLWNPITYLVEGIRATMHGWDLAAYGTAVGAALALAVAAVAASVAKLRRMDV